MFSLKNSFKGGVKINAAKELTENIPIQKITPPEIVVLPLAMHIGAPAKTLVQKGERVVRGQKIAAAQGTVSANIHASVSGTVAGIEKRWLPGGKMSECIIIKNDFTDETVPATPHSPERLTAEAIRALLLEHGITGMGGASFPTHVKYLPPPQGSIDTVILNGIECEPYITADYRILLEQPQLVIRGLQYFLKAAGAQRGIIAIEDNKPQAIALFKQLVQGSGNISVTACPEKYPQGGEKQLIKAVTGRSVPVGGLPADVGVIVDNVSTAMQAARSIESGLPFTERVITVSGNAVNNPGNFLVPLGTLYSHVVTEAAHGFKTPPAVIICGGPMMGFALQTLDYPVTKGANALLCFDESSAAAAVRTESTCVRCGRCVDHCPMFLEPTEITRFVKQQNLEAIANLHAQSCIECGCCSYVCPAHIPLVQYIRLGKQLLAQKK